jgi:hypothetical protein
MMKEDDLHQRTKKFALRVLTSYFLLCLRIGKYPDHISKRAIVTLRVHVYF